MACGDQMISVTGGGDALPCCALPLVQHRAAPTLARPSPGAPTAQSRLPPWHRLVASRSLRGPSAWQYYPTFVPPWIWPHATPSRYTKHHVALSAVGCPSMRRTRLVSGRPLWAGPLDEVVGRLPDAQDAINPRRHQLEPGSGQCAGSLGDVHYLIVHVSAGP